MNEIEPKPPEIIQNFEWIRLYGTNHKGKLIIAVLFLSLGGWTFLPKIHHKILKTFHVQKVEAINNGMENSSNKLKAPSVRFSDGSVKVVEMSVQIHLDEELILEAASLYGSQEKAMTALNASILGATLAILETKTEDYVRKHRVELANRIINQTKETQKITAHKIVELSIGEIL